MKFEKRKLSNGITVLFEKRDVPVVSLSISNPFAASHETADIKGVAHLIEHLLFTGTKTRTHEDISREIEKKGGILNAFTAEDVTSYWFKLPSEHVLIGLRILVDMLKNPSFNKEKFEKEKKVVLEEIKMYHDMPQVHIYEKIQENMFEPPFGIGIIGTKNTVSSLTRDFVVNYFEEKYSPENFIVTVVGKTDIDKICALLEEEFSPKNKVYSALEIKKKSGKSIEEREGIDQAHFMFGVHAPFASESEHEVLEVLDAYLASGMSSKLFLEIREKRGLAYSINGSINTERNYSFYTIYVGTTKEAMKEVEKIILEEINNIQNLNEVQLNEAKERLIGLRKITSEESSKVMNSLLFSEIATAAEDYYENEKKINKVTLEQVKHLAKTLVKNYSTAAIVPK